MNVSEVAIGAKDNVLYELAQAMVTNSEHSAAVALRKLAQAGFDSLDEVDSASDWVLLSIPGLGVGRLGAVRRLTRLGWQPPSPQAVKAVNRFASAARFALRFWPLETLISLVRGYAPAKVTGGPVEKRLALDVFSLAAQKALRYCGAEELAGTLRLAGNGHHGGTGQGPQFPCSYGVQVQVCEIRHRETSILDSSEMPCDKASTDEGSDHYAYPRDKRYEIVCDYRAARARGGVANKDRWAQANYGISGRTLLRYEIEFP